MDISTITAEELMQRDVVTFAESISLFDAYQTLQEKHISGAPVVNEAGAVVGVLSQTDLIKQSYLKEFDEFAPNSFYVEIPYVHSPDFQEIAEKLRVTSVSDVMSTNVLSISSDASVAQIAATMRTNGVHRLIVMEGDALCGIVTTFDLLKLFK